ncbi:MAG: 5-histidylcysteine sulfoxide synthase [Alphaproteobacteria bacterium]|nr:5-histidylcysteine sulfoxide synthase [Alphaproteobacteria bacterium]
MSTTNAHRLRSQAPPSTNDLDPARLASYFDDTWALYEVLFSAVSDAALRDQPDPLRHPLVFYLGHTAAFYVNKLVMAGLVGHGIDPGLEELFAKGVDPARAAGLERHDLWPSGDVVRDYRHRVHALVHEVIAGLEPGASIDGTSPVWALYMGLEHDRIHLETSSVLIRQAAPERLVRPAGWGYADPTDTAPEARWVAIEPTEVRLGRPSAHDRFGWDNEFGALDVPVEAFECRAHLATNRELHAFWADGGYADPRLWSTAGWAWLQELGVRGPRFWRWEAPKDPQPRLRVMFDEIAMPWSWPAEVNGFEADALARWSGARVMREAEWAAMVDDAALVDGDCIDAPAHALSLRSGSPVSVDASEPTPRGVHDAYGNVWQWLSDDFRPLPGFTPHPLYADFSAPYFTPRHGSLRGGSWISTGTSASRFYRLWFRRHFYQHAGVRLARDV